MVTKEQYKAACDALQINEGACNGRGVSKALAKAYDAWEGDTDESNRSAPVRLILYQLCHLAKIPVDLSMSEYGEDVNKCKQIKEEYESSK